MGANKKLVGIAFALVAVIVIALVVKQGLQIIAPAPTEVPVPRRAQAQPPATPTQIVQRQGTYARDYRVTFFYSGQQISVKDVAVSRLQRRRAVVRYHLSVTPAGGNDRWVNRSNFFLTRANARRRAQRVRFRRLGSARITTVTFKVPSRMLRARVFLSINYPLNARTRRGENVKLALEVPRP